ncbi:MAG: hypothetical protein CMI54_01835 [Parcubacteria group bacterium]|nr:hypothetical protein [Parcubacteria group bacterium]|tara:strand:+ start:5703 stop:6116 length:414 start_codon:yes stop_codon:yes gene_type:complete
MALETTLVYKTGQAIPFTVANGTGIEKGAVLKLTDPMTAATTTGDTDACAGIAASEKIASDGKVKLGVFREGIFRGFAGAAGVTAGQGIITDTSTGAANELVNADVNSENIVGVALETATDGQSFLFELKPFGINLA